jgi:hypothetical protein
VLSWNPGIFPNVVSGPRRQKSEMAFYTLRWLTPEGTGHHPLNLILRAFRPTQRGLAKRDQRFPGPENRFAYFHSSGLQYRVNSPRSRSLTVCPAPRATSRIAAQMARSFFQY